MKYETCFYNPPTHTVIDVVNPLNEEGRSVYARETVEDMRKRYPAIEVVTLDEASQRIDEAMRSPPKRITRERFWEMWKTLFPEDWHHDSGSESFKLVEHTCGNITAIFCRIGEDYWEMQDTFTLPHVEIVARCVAAAKS